jgi:hypothetical protein
VVAWLILTLPVVCHQDTAVLILNAVTAGHEHQHMMAGSAANHQHASAVQHHPTTAPATESATVTRRPLPTITSLALGSPSPQAWGQWRAHQATPLGEGLPAAQDGATFFALAAVEPPSPAAGALADGEATTPDSQRRAPPAPPPRALLG